MSAQAGSVVLTSGVTTTLFDISTGVEGDALKGVFLAAWGGSCDVAITGLHVPGVTETINDYSYVERWSSIPSTGAGAITKITALASTAGVTVSWGPVAR